MRRFEKNIELDARMVIASMQGGIDGLMNFAFLNRSHFPTTKDATDRAEWLKRQDDEYIKLVSEKAAELE